MAKIIVRTKTKATGGVTHDELVRLKSHSEKWIAIALQTGRVDRVRVNDSIKSLYRVSGLKEPKVVVVQSPFMMCVVGAMASEYWARGGDTRDAADGDIRVARRTKERIEG